MGILTRFKDIMSANVNALLDKAEDPAKMIDQTLLNLRKDLAEVKKETAAVMADAIVRIIPGVISDEQSALSDSFQDNLLAAPVYTRPADYNGWKVPEILLSGHEAKIKEWELQQSLERTRRLRPDLLGEE